MGERGCVPAGTPVTNRRYGQAVLSRGWRQLRKVFSVACAITVLTLTAGPAGAAPAGGEPPSTAAAAGPAGQGAGTGTGAVPFAPAAKAVPPTLVDLPLVSTQRSGGPLAVSRPTGARFSTVGVTWAADPAVGAVTLDVRTRTGSGPWSAWTRSEQDDKEPDPGARPAARGGTEPVWTGPATGVEARVTPVSGAAPRDVRLTLVDPGTSAADAAPPASTQAAGKPAIFSRAQWGADPALLGWDPQYAPSLKAGFLHHTVGTNSYTAAQVPAILRSIYAFHSQTRDWGDIGYNFLVDKFGRVWEGRAGGVDSAVIAAHAGGFNAGTFGVALLGTHQSVAVPPAALDAVSSVFAWKLDRWNLDPYGTATLTSGGGGTSRYPAGTVVRKNVVSGHRDVGLTECPGDRAYAALGTVRAQVKAKLGAAPATPALVNPAITPAAVAYGAAGPRVTAGLTGSTAWTVRVTRDCPAQATRTFSGTGSGVDTRWDLKDSAGRTVRPGTYVLTLYPNAAGTGAGFATRVTVLPPTAAPPLATGALPSAGPAGYVPVAPVRVLDTRTDLGGGDFLPVGGGRRVDVPVLGIGGVPASGVAAVLVSATGFCSTVAGPLTVFPAGTARPLVTAVSVDPGAGSTQALAAVRVGAGGKVSVTGGSGSTDAVLDVVGYLPVAGGAGLRPVAGTRILDVTVGAGQTRQVPVPAPGASAALLNVAAVSPAGGGALRVWPIGEPRPAAANHVYVAGVTSSDRVAVGVADGAVQVQNDGASPVRVALDLTGWYGATGARFTAVVPMRISVGTVPAARDTAVPVRGRAGVPANATAVVASLSAKPTGRSWLAAWGSGARPPTADLHAEAGAWETTTVVLPIGPDGSVRLYSASAPASAVLDVIGWYR